MKNLNECFMENLIKLMIFDKSDVFNWRVLVVNWWQVTCAMLVTLWDNCLGTWNTVEGDQDKSSLDQLPVSLCGLFIADNRR